MASRGDRIKEILFEALEIPAEEIDDFLGRACGDDADLLAEVRKLLDAHDDAGEFMAAPDRARESATSGSGSGAGPRTGTRIVPGTPEGEGLGSRVGNYRLIRVLGEGGFGTVYLAQQEKLLARTVALKVLKVGMDSSDLIRRFEVERQALALMHHPGIARVLDAGTTDEGRPFFAMEYVDGEPITDYCDRNRLTIRQRLHLLEQVCLAVQHAHQKGVIHRDLKPTNILVSTVDGAPLPKVIDFGIAKALGPRLTRQTVVTRSGHVIGTPEYMSPEQATASEDTDTRTDVYSLGIILYRLLTGESPFDEEKLRMIGEWARAIREDEPMRPSTRIRAQKDRARLTANSRRTTPQRLQKILHTELDWIVMTALEKDRRRRYPTAAALAGDLRAYLEDRPIEASPPSVAYRVGKFWRRHKAAVLMLVSIAVILVAATTISITAAVRATGARNEARKHEQQASLALAEVRKQREEADAARQEAEWQSYVANVHAADGNLYMRDTGAARRRLLAAPERHRGWEWDVLMDRTDPSVHTTRYEKGRAFSMVPHPTEPILVLGGQYGEIRVVDYGRDREITRLRGHEGGIHGLALSSSGPMIYSGSGTGQVWIWNHESGEKTELPPHQDRIFRLVVDREETVVVTASRDGTARITDIATGRALQIFQHGTPVHDLAVLPDASRIVTASWDHQLRIWNVETGERIHQRTVCRPETEAYRSGEWSAGKIDSLALDPVRREILTGTRDGRITLVDLDTGEELWSNGTLHRDIVRSVAFSPDGTRFAVACRDRTASLWDRATLSQVRTLRDFEHDARHLRFSPDSRLLAIASWDRSVKLHRADDGRALGTLLGHEAGIYEARFHPSRPHLLTRSEDGTVKAWALSDATRKTLYPHEEFVHTVVVSGDRLVTANARGSASVHDLATGSLIRQGMSHGPGITSANASPDGELLATGAVDGGLRLWNLTTGDAVADFAPHAGEVFSVDFSPDGALLLSTSRDGRARVRDVDSRELKREVSLDGDRIHAGRFLPDSSRFVIGTYRGRLQVHDVGTEEPLVGVRTSDGSAIRALALDPRPGSSLVAAASGRTILLFDLDSGEVVRSIRAHVQSLTDIAWFPDGERLATVSWDRSLRLWDVETGDHVASFRGHQKPIHAVAVSADGRSLVTGDETGMVRIWRAR